jgi:hypothetical protein
MTDVTDPENNTTTTITNSYATYMRDVEAKTPKNPYYYLREQYGTLAVIIYEPEGGKLSDVLVPEEFDDRGPADYREPVGTLERIAKVAIEHWHQHNKAPGEEIFRHFANDELALNLLNNITRMYRSRNKRYDDGGYTYMLLIGVENYVNNRGGKNKHERTIKHERTTREQIIELFQQGKRQTEIVDITGVSKGLVSRYIAEFEDR